MVLATLALKVKGNICILSTSFWAWNLGFTLAFLSFAIKNSINKLILNNLKTKIKLPFVDSKLFQMYNGLVFLLE